MYTCLLVVKAALILLVALFPYQTSLFRSSFNTIRAGLEQVELEGRSSAVVAN